MNAVIATKRYKETKKIPFLTSIGQIGNKQIHIIPTINPISIIFVDLGLTCTTQEKNAFFSNLLSEPGV